MTKQTGRSTEANAIDQAKVAQDMAKVGAEVRRELAAAGHEARSELRAAGIDTRRALREAMEEARTAIGAGLRTTRSETRRAARRQRLSRAERKELTRESLLDAAIEVFARKGYAGASLDDVAEAAGFTKGAVYSNFATKADLFMALLGRQSGRRGAALMASLESAPLELLPDLASMWLAEQAGEERDWDILTIEFWLAAVRDPEIRAQVTAGRVASLSTVGDILDAKFEAADRHPGFSGRELMTILEALGAGLLMNIYLDPDSGNSDLLARATRKLLADEDRPRE